MNYQNPKTSIIIRTRNEDNTFEEVLSCIEKQTYQDFEIIVVDDNSTDKTQQIAKEHDCKIVLIPEGKFSHPYSCNLGAQNAQGKYLVYLNGHALPISDTWLADGLKNFKDKKIAGIYAFVIARKNSTLADKILYDVVGRTIGALKFKANKKMTGVLGTTNAIIRKDLWNQYHFNEKFNSGWGGEDTNWARYFMERGYCIVHEPKFRVRHSHNLSWKDFFWQLKNWLKMAYPVLGIPEKQRKNV